ncbi:hypothetical protein APHAL10511_007712 [Amanita phalloides]|nr:hypothetical protein APHAL10511_007712 [Amanita phalloides]
MPSYARAAPVFNASVNNRNDRLQPFREPNTLNTNAAASSNRPNRRSADHQPSPVTPAVTGIAYPAQEDDDLEFDEPLHSTSNTGDNSRGQRHPITIDQNNYHYNHSSSRTNNHNSGNRYNQPTTMPQTNTHGNGNMGSSSQDDNSSDQVGGASHGGENTLDQIWDAIREKKARKMAKERAKVESLEEITGELALSDHQLHPTLERHHPHSHSQGGLPHSSHQPSAAQMMDNIETMSVPMPISQDHMQSGQETASRQMKKRKSIVSFRESRDGRSMNATIELPPEVKKQDVHISFNAKRLVVSWMVIDITEWEEDDGHIVRERVEQIFQRTLPLGEGTRYEEIKSYMMKNRLIIRYPNMRCIRVETKPSDGA